MEAEQGSSHTLDLRGLLFSSLPHIDLMVMHDKTVSILVSAVTILSIILFHFGLTSRRGNLAIHAPIVGPSKSLIARVQFFYGARKAINNGYQNVRSN